MINNRNIVVHGTAPVHSGIRKRINIPQHTVQCWFGSREGAFSFWFIVCDHGTVADAAIGACQACMGRSRRGKKQRGRRCIKLLSLNDQSPSESVIQRSSHSVVHQTVVGQSHQRQSARDARSAPMAENTACSRPITTVLYACVFTEHKRTIYFSDKYR